MGVVHNAQTFILGEYLLVVRDFICFFSVEDLDCFEPLHYCPDLLPRKIFNCLYFSALCLLGINCQNLPVDFPLIDQAETPQNLAFEDLSH